MASGAPRVDVREKRNLFPVSKGVPTSVAGFAGPTERGPTGKAVRITSSSQFSRIFGGSWASSYMFEAVDGFFKEGGQTCHIARVVASSGNSAAAFTLQDATPTNTIPVTAIGVGLYGNNQKVKVSKQDTKLGALTVALATAATFAVVESGAAAKIQKGDTLKITDGVTTTRVIVKGVSGTKVFFTAAVTLGATIAYATSVITNETFTFTVYENGNPIFGPLKDLRMSSLSDRNYFVSRINKDGNDPEVPVTVSDAGVAPSGTVDPRPVNTSSDSDGDSLTGGTENTTYADTDFTGANKGYNLFDATKEVRLLATPGATGITVTGAISKGLIAYCAARGDCVAIVETADGLTASSALTYFSTNQVASSYAACYWPWVTITDPLSGLPLAVPPAGHVCGAIARTHAKEKIAKAPAGETSGKLVSVLGVSGVKPGEDLSDSDVGTLYDANINCIRNLPNNGPTIMGGRTYESGDFGWLHVRLMFIYAEQFLKQATRFVLFEPTTPETRAAVRRTVLAFIRREWGKKNLDGATADDAGYCNCDDDNNPPSLQASGETYAVAGLNVPGTTEYLTIELGRDNRAITAELGGLHVDYS